MVPKLATPQGQRAAAMRMRPPLAAGAAVGRARRAPVRKLAAGQYARPEAVKVGWWAVHEAVWLQPGQGSAVSWGCGMRGFPIPSLHDGGPALPALL